MIGQVFSAYSEYKDSGIDWLGEIPKHWEVKKIKMLCQVKRGASPRPIDSPIYFDNDGEYAWVRISDVTASDRYLLKTEQRLSKLGQSKSVALEPDELFLSIAGSVGKPIITKIKCCIHDGFVYFENLKENRDYLFYLFLGGELYKGLGKLGTQLNLNSDTVGSIVIPVPSFEDQKQIATFLDRATTEIDQIIEQQKQLITLLEEERTTVISHAVTKGLDPSVPMKDSGIEWLGEIPKHWDVKKLRYVGSCQNGVSKGGDYFGSGYPFVNYTDVYSHIKLPQVVSGLAQSTDSDRINYSVQAGDIFFTRTSETIEEIGIASTCLNTIQNAIFSGFLIKFRPFDNLLYKEFSKYYFRCQLHRHFFVKEMNLVTRASLSQELLKRLPILIPSLSEQQAIASFLDQETVRIDEAIDNVRSQIEKLEEYRTVLISDAVTGKIDVRGFS